MGIGMVALVHRKGPPVRSKSSVQRRKKNVRAPAGALLFCLLGLSGEAGALWRDPSNRHQRIGDDIYSRHQYSLWKRL